MRKLAFGGLVLMLVCGLGGCGKSKHEAVVDDAIALMNDVGDIVESVNDKATADAAVQKIEKLGPRVKELSERVKALPEPSKEEQERLTKRIDEQQEKMQKRMETKRKTLMQFPEVFVALMKVGGEMGDMPKWMGGSKKTSGEFKQVGGTLPNLDK